MIYTQHETNTPEHALFANSLMSQTTHDIVVMFREKVSIHHYLLIHHALASGLHPPSTPRHVQAISDSCVSARVQATPKAFERQGSERLQHYAEAQGFAQSLQSTAIGSRELANSTENTVSASI